MKNFLSIFLIFSLIYGDAFAYTRYPAPSGGGGTGTGNILTINSDVTADQIISIGTIGSDIAISDPGSGQHAINIPTASSTKRGALSSTDWSTFNGKQTSTLTNGNFLVGNGSNAATSVTPTGDVTFDNTGAFSIGATKVTNSMLSGSIAFTKLASLTNGNFLVGNGSNVATSVTPSGDVTFDNTGAFAIGAGKVTSAMLAGSIAYSKLSLTGAILNADLAGSIAYSKLSLTGAILNADLAGSIAFSKLAALTSGNFLIGNGSNVATSVAPTGDVTFDNTGAFAIGAGKIVNSQVNASAAIAYSKLNLSGSVVNADVSSSAAIANSKLATMADQRFKGNVSGGSAVPSDLTVSQVKTALNTAPTVQKLTSGTSATYTRPAGVLYIRVRMVGGGGGGANETGGFAGGNGASTTFTDGSLTLTALGGTGGAVVANGTGQAGAGGSATISSGTGLIVPGNSGNSAVFNITATAMLGMGGSGGGSMFGGAGIGQATNNGTAATAGVANSGGGGGGNSENASSKAGGCGGGGGGGIDMIITNPSATYTYTIGAGGTRVGAATDGGSGLIYVEEFYQ